MKLITYRSERGDRLAAQLNATHAVDLLDAAQRRGSASPDSFASMLALIRGGDAALVDARALAAAADDQRARLMALVAHAEKLLRGHNRWKASGSPIQPIILGTDARAMRFAEALQGRGYDIRAIRPPTVPEGTARLRLALTTHVTQSDLDAVFAHLAAELERA